MDTKNVIAAISLSAAVIILYGLFFAPTPQEPKLTQKNNNSNIEVTNTDAPSLDQNEEVIKSKLKNNQERLKETELAIQKLQLDITGLNSKINTHKDILIFVDAKKNDINKKIKKRKNFNFKIVKKLKKVQLPVEFKKKQSDFIIKNNFKSNYVKKNAKKIMEKILLNV